MSKKVDATMSTEIALDILQPSKSIKTMTNLVNTATKAWKAQESQLKSTGDYLAAAEKRYNGLGEAIKKQENVINALKEKQSQLKGNTAETAEQYLKFERQIDAAKTKLASMQSQQTRAKQAIDLQKSGVIGLSTAMKQQETLMNAHVEKLQAEGKGYSALKTNIDGLRDRYKSLQTIQSKENELLEKIKQDSGEASDAYKKQQTRVYDLGTKVAETRTKIKELNSQLEKTPHGFLSGISSKLDKIQEKADKTSHIFGKVFGANLLANGVSNAWTNITSHISEATDAVKNYNDKQQVMNATWNTLTGSASKGKAMVDVGNQLASAYGQNINVVDELNQQFYHVFNNKGKTEELTKSVLTLGDTLGLSDENVTRLGTNFTHMMSSGKMQLGDFNMITDQLPMYGEKLLDYERKVQHNSKLTMSQLRNEMSAGKVSAKDAEAVMNGLGQKYQKASENLMKTIPGMTRSIKTQMPALLDAMYKPIANMKNPLLGQISKWVGDKSTQNEFKKVGNSISRQISDITAAFGGKKINVTGGLDSMMKKLNTAINSLGKTIIKHKSDIKNFIGSVKTAAVTNWKILVQVLKDLEPVLKIVGGLAAKYPKQFAAFAVAGVALSKSLTLVSGGLKAVAAVKGVKAMFVAKDAVTGAKNLTLLGQGVKLFGSSIATVGKFLLTNPLGIFLTVITAIAVGLTELYKHNAKFRKFVNNLVKSAQEFAKSSIKWFGKAWNDIKKGASESWKNTKKAFSDGWNNTVKSTQKGYKDTTKWFGKLWSGTKKGVSDSWKNTKSVFSDGWDNTKKLTKTGASWVSDRWTGLKNDTSKIANAMKNSHNNTFRSLYSTLNSYTQTWHDVMSGKWGKVGSDIRNVANGLKNTVQSIFSGMYSTLNNLTGGRLGQVLGTFSSIFGSIKRVVNDASSGVRHGAIGIARAVISPINTMLSGLRKGINWILGKVGAHGIGSFNIPLPAYAKGTKQGVLHDQLALVNDAKGSKYREMYRTPDGQVGMFPAQRNMIVPLKAGTEILNGEDSAKLAKVMGLSAFKSGTFNFDFSGLEKLAHMKFDFGGLGQTFSNTASFIGNTVDDIMDHVDDIMAKPAKFFLGVLQKHLNVSAKGIAGSIVTSFPVKLAEKGANWIKKLFKNFLGSMSNPAGSGVGRWRSAVIRGLAANHLSTSADMVAKVLRQINTESGGNPHARQPGSDPDGDGSGPALGLMQTKRRTFNAYKFRGHNNIFNGFDDILAGLAYAKARYGKSLYFLGHGHGYANGGLINKHGLYEIAEQNKPEMIIPLSTAKRSRAWQLLSAVVASFVGNDSNSQTKSSQGNDKDSERIIQELKADISDMKETFKNMLALMSLQLSATKELNIDATTKYRQQATEAKFRAMQTL